MQASSSSSEQYIHDAAKSASKTGRLPTNIDDEDDCIQPQHMQ
jgi:hypothetical protein